MLCLTHKIPDRLNPDAIDLNYAFGVIAGTATGTACASTTGFCGHVAIESGFPVTTHWIAPGGSSAWLTPSSEQAKSYDASSNGYYTWTLSFDLAGFDPTTASFSGQFAADNGSTVTLNGSSSVLATANSFSNWTGFSATSGFVAGLNTLMFTVTNTAQPSGNPTGLRVEFLTSSVSPIPEPASYALMLCGLLAVAGAARRRIRG